MESAMFRRTVGHFTSGICVITAMWENQPTGFTCQSFSGLSLEPPLVLFCVSKNASVWPSLNMSGHFCVNVLASEHQRYSHQFAFASQDRFKGVEWTSGLTGAPRINDAIAHIDCRIDAVHDGGDHHIVVGRVLDLFLQREGVDPLIFYRATYGTFAQIQQESHDLP